VTRHFRALVRFQMITYVAYFFVCAILLVQMLFHDEFTDFASLSAENEKVVHQFKQCEQLDAPCINKVLEAHRLLKIDANKWVASVTSFYTQFHCKFDVTLKSPVFPSMNLGIKNAKQNSVECRA